MELLGSGEAETTQHLRAIIMAEALGRPVDKGSGNGSDEEGDEDEEVDDATREIDGRKESAGSKDGKEEDEDGSGKKIDIKIPQEAIDAGTRVVRMALDKHVDIAPETAEEERQWRDWR